MDNTNKNPIFSIKDFRSFGEDGADFELAPITVLTGCNSAGKSSMVKALLLLSNQTDDHIMYGYNEVNTLMPSSTLPVSSRELALGNYNKIINNKSGKKTLDLSYTIWSSFLQEFVIVRRVFGGNSHDALNDGKLLEYTIEKTDGTTIYIYREYTPHEPSTYFETIRDNYEAFVMSYELKDLMEQIESPDTLDENDLVEEMIAQVCYVDQGGVELGKDDLTEEMRSELISSMKEYAAKYKEVVAPFVKDKIGINQCFLQWSDVIKKRNDRSNSWKAMLGESKRFDKTIKKRIYRIDNMNYEKEYLSLVNNEVIRPFFIHKVEYADSSSAKIKRLYSAEDNDKVSIAIKKLNRRHVNDRESLDLGIADFSFAGSFLTRWLKEFDLGDKLSIEGTAEGLGLTVSLIKNGEKRLLADEGYGITQLVSLLLIIDNCIPFYPDKISSEGKDGYNERFICVEEPENHLHPKFQSLLAEMFVEAYQKYNIHFIIETHSEYLIRKLQVMVADKENALTSDDVSLNYVEKNEEGVSHNRQIKIKEDGSLSEPFGKGFYDEADDLTMELLRYKAQIRR